MASIDLKKASGLPLKLDLETNKLIFGKGLKEVEADIRTREKMASVLKNPNVEAPHDFYYMYRDVHLNSDEKIIRANDLRYDITILPPFSVGGEFNKTFGHFHPKVADTDTWYPEVYEVLHGHAHYLLQNGEEFLVYDARQGDKCVMLPGFGHITVNPSSTPLVMANWVYPGFNSDYGPIERMHGGQYYETHHGFVQNHHYADRPHVKLISAKEFAQFGLTQKPIYSQFLKTPKKFEWLVRPQDFGEEFLKYRKL
ncbi:MAG TPA: glucose-6-phosphate isomerase family protein [archaeon]|nr:glucose-6-phosphate isomerase family protein [archaeon]